MSTYTLELSEYQGLAGSSNGEWSNLFQNKMSLEEGDVLQIKQALINTQSASVDSVNVTQDTVARITVGFYDQCVSDSNTCTMKMLPANMQATADGNDPFAYRWEVFDSGVGGYVKSRAINTAGTDYNTPWVAVTWDGSKYTRQTLDIDITIPKGIYSPNDLADIITKGMQTSNTTQTFLDQGSKANVTPIAGTTENYDFFCLPSHYPNIKDATQLVIADNEYIFRGDYDTGTSTEYVAGAPSPALVYENERFQFQFLHMPVLINADGDSSKAPYTEIGASSYSLTSGEEDFFSRYSGIYLIDVSVQSGDFDFWSLLGFTQTSFVDEFCSDIDKFTTTAFINAGAYQNKNYSLPVHELKATDSFNYFVTSDDSTSVSAEANYQYDESGYYLISVISTFNNNYITENSTLSKVSCVASKQYSAGDFVTAYADSSIVYQHKGEPVLLTKFDVQILEPKTRQIANDLGGNSTLFLEIIKSDSTSIASKKKDGKSN